MRHHSPVARTPPASIAQRLMEPLTVMESFDVLRDGDLGLGLTLDEEKGTKKRGRESLLDHRFAAPAPAALNSGPATSSFTRSGCQNRSSNNDSRPLSFRDLTGYSNSTQRRNRSVSCTGSSTKRSWSKSSPLESAKISRSIRKHSSGSHTRTDRTVPPGLHAAISLSLIPYRLSHIHGVSNRSRSARSGAGS